MFIDEISKKYNYSEDLTNVLRIIYPYLVNMFSGDIIVNEVLKNVEIIFTDNVYDELKGYDLLDEKEAMVSSETLRYSAGAYASKPIVNYNDKNNEYVLSGINRNIIINASDISYDSTKGTLVHELLHAIKSYFNEYIIKDDIIHEYSGFIEKEYKLNYENNKVTTNLIKEIGVGLEEGFNVRQEEYLTRKLASNYSSKGYSLLKEVANHFAQIGLDNIETKIIYSEEFHDFSFITNYLNEDYYEYLLVVDNLYKMNLEVMDFRISDEERKIKVNELKTYIKDIYIPLNERIKGKISSSDNEKVK